MNKFKKWLASSLMIIIGSILFYWISCIHWTIALFIVSIVGLVYILEE